MGGEKKETRSQKDPSWNFYYYPYILRTGEVCNWRYYDPKGCKVHQDSRQIPCKQLRCEEQTRSKYDYCDTHVKKHRSKEHYHQKKLDKLASTQILVGNLEVNKNDTT